MRRQQATRILAAVALMSGALAGCEDHAGNPGIEAKPNQALTAAEVDGIIVRAVSLAQALGVDIAVAVTDRDGEVLGAFRTSTTTIDISRNVNAAVSKAATVAAFQSEQNAFTTRSALFIVQGHYPPGIRNLPGGPLFGVQDSSQISSDSHAAAYDQDGNQIGAGITGEFGGLPLYKNETPVGGVGIDIADELQILQGAATLVSPLLNDLDEVIAQAAVGPFQTPKVIDATNAFVDGFSLPFIDTGRPPRFTLVATSTAELIANGMGEIPLSFATSSTTLDVRTSPLVPEDKIDDQFGLRVDRRFIPRIVATTTSTSFTPVAVDMVELGGETAPTFDGRTYRFLNVPIVDMTVTSTPQPGTHFIVPAEVRYQAIDSIDPPPSAGGVTREEILDMAARGIKKAEDAAAGIRLPRGEGVRVHIVVVDRRGNILGLFRMGDGTLFSLDVAVQKARTCAFFSTGAGDTDPDGNPLPTIAVGARSIGFMAQPFFPPGIDGKPPGPLARLRDLINRGKIPVEPHPSLLVVFPPPRPPSAGTANGVFLTPVDDDILTPGFQTFNDFTATTTPPFEAIGRIRAAINETGGPLGGFNVLADRDAVNRGDTVTFVSPGCQSGIQTFPGGVPLYRDGVLIGAVGVSGDGVDEDDIVAFFCSLGFEPPLERRIDNAEFADIAQVMIAKAERLARAMENHPDPDIRAVYGPVFRAERDRIQASFDADILDGVRIPYVKFPREPDAK